MNNYHKPAALDYGMEVEAHRLSLDEVINNHGALDMEKHIWHPHEVIALGKNVLKPEHEREFVACAGIILNSILLGNTSDDWEISMESLRDYWHDLKDEHKLLLEPLVAQVNQLV